MKKSFLTSNLINIRRNSLMSSHAHTMNHSKTKGGTPALLALAISAFGIGTTEFVPVGLLSSIADDLSISITLAGLLISGYAVGVAIGAPVLTALTSKMSRKSLLMSLMILFIVGNSVSALSTSFGLLLVARFITAFSQVSFSRSVRRSRQIWSLPINGQAPSPSCSPD